MNVKSEIPKAKQHLFDDFSTPTFQQWREVAEKTLKGATIEEKLVTDTYEGIALQPLYRKEDIENKPYLSTVPGDFPYLRGTHESGFQQEPWKVCQEIAYSNPEEFNLAARNDLEKGLTMLHVILDETRWSDPDHKKINLSGVSIDSLQDFQQAFQGMNLEEVPIFIENGISGFPFFASFIAYLQQQNQDFNRIRGCIGMDPIGQLVQKGVLPYSLNQAFEMMSEMTKWSLNNSPELKTIVVQAHPYHDAGGNAVQELAFAIATGLQYLRNLKNHEISIDDIAQRIAFSFSIGSNFFMEIAKFRAARMLWAKIVMELGGNANSQKMFIHGRTSARTKTIHDPYVNILRGTAEAFAGIIGGVNSLHVSTFDEANGLSDEFSRRIARNTHMILDKEANLSKVTDPAGGSWYIETLTYTLAEKSWELFQQIEELGGMYKALLEGFPQDTVSKTAEIRIENIKSRKDKIIGTNIYPNLNEKMESRDSISARNDEVNYSYSNVDYFYIKDEIQDFINNQTMENAIKAASAGASIDDLLQVICFSIEQTPSVCPVRIHRDAEPFESLRKNAKEYKKKTGHHPLVFVANIGSGSDYNSRADFVTEFFEVGGFQVNQHESSQTITDAVDEFRISNAGIVVIVGNNEDYLECVPSFVRSIKEFKRKTVVLLAGDPSEKDTAIYMEAGVDDFIHPNISTYEKLVDLQKKVGISR
ncbi:acyl-CoA mutase large subunit family protein [Neobacillus cucumis]|uniref:methylmalonyl-CoA mutase family protein n=1 Tax=Neobacillus cucumis TaxID=1740721 RepID=UPI0018DF2015|nr:methylmalonyl-CoA mutase family protein [Neobacillus cucumis]MBI0575873.1 acyl-CoA mutase large subunit family protein [Neobacillus cucumis]